MNPTNQSKQEDELREQLVELAQPYIKKLVKVVEVFANGGKYAPHNPNKKSLVDAIMQFIQSRDEAREREVQAVIDAFTIKGSHPEYHDSQLRRLETEWPSLYFAVKSLTTHPNKHGEE